MGSSIFLISVVLVPVAFAHMVAGNRLAVPIGIAGVGFLLTLLLFNDAFPFTGGGDDADYYYASMQPFTDFRDWFDTTQYDHEQAGYPLLLSWVHQVSGDSLFHRKALNVFFMLGLAIVWFAIGKLIGGKRLAFVYAYGTLLATPLWYYWLFLLKDMAITLLQSLFILGLIEFVSGERRLRGYALIALSTLALIPFRSILALFNVALVVIAFTLLQGRSGTSGISFATRLILVASMVVGLWLLSVQPGLMETLGAKGEDRSFTLGGLESLAERAETERQQFSHHPLTFPILYFVGETDALNPANWGQFDLGLLRPLSMVPWIFLGLPFFLAGVATMLRRRRDREMFVSGMRHSDDNRTTEDYSRRQAHGLRVLLIFIVGYAALGWFSGTTTRWTLPAIPPMIGIAGFACTNMNNHARVSLLTAFGLSLLALIFIYYWVLR